MNLQDSIINCTLTKYLFFFSYQYLQDHGEVNIKMKHNRLNYLCYCSCIHHQQT